ncbi:hypothetical protein SERLADRAFT_401291 [Serpula lacrymans var. lacrymans S7.9]|uniref:Uncharacterized protein n=1 Tax=Serpula lacrymans var. lacrymans (strain S7.9) TaxID=578457 RepID=F8PAU9_SERL9|nr:uncharacterized protein SERLADRAFT_401291 [Serpula lacrymans var. lacrymans S7.9]EGO19937.1 hypothetical protein SERLADRAFT_401291 [Serpula lacrymans var. lacrymans S7.9]
MGGVENRNINIVLAGSWIETGLPIIWFLIVRMRVIGSDKTLNGIVSPRIFTSNSGASTCTA